MSDDAQAGENAQGNDAAPAAPAMSQAEKRAATLRALEADNLEDDPFAPPAAKPKDDFVAAAKKLRVSGPDADDDDDLDDDEESDDDLDESDDEDDDLDLSADDEDDADDDEDDEDEPDPSLDHKALAKVKQAERRAKQTEERAQAMLAQARQIEASVKERVAKAESFEKLIARIPYEGLGPVLDLIAPNLDDDTLETTARELFTRSSRGAKDAAGKQAVAQRQRERKLEAELAELRKRLDGDAEARKQQESIAASAREGRAYLAKVVKKAGGGKTPLAAKALAKGATDRAVAIAEVAAIAARLGEQAGAVPSTKKVLRAFEKRLRALRGDDAAPNDSVTAIPAKDGTKNRSQNADENRPAPKSDDGDQPPKDLRARRAWTAKRLEAGLLD